MNKFHFACRGEIFFGQNCISEHTDIFSRLGKRAYIVSSRFMKGARNLALEDVKLALAHEGISFQVDEEAQPDPSVESVVAIRERVMAFHPDFLVAVGGGSAMDSVKCLNVLLNFPEGDPYDVLFGKGPHVYGVGGPDQGLLPFISVPTTAGTGSEIAGVAVMTRNDLQTKFGTNRRSFADYVFVDSRYVRSCPECLNQATALDALCHGIEIYISRDSRDDFMTNMLTEKALRLFADIKEPLRTNHLSEEDSDKQALMSMLAGIIIANELTGVAHGLGYPLSYYYHVSHGFACALFQAEYLRVLKDQTRVRHVLDLMGFEELDSFRDYMQGILLRHVDIAVTPQQIESWTKEFCATRWRVDRHPEPLAEDTVREIYLRALAPFLS